MNNLINTPFNYAGNKFNLLPQLFSKFPKDINNFYDAFVGSGSVFINVDAKKYHINDIISSLIYFLSLLKVTANKDSAEKLFETLYRIQTENGLDKNNPNFKENYNKFRDKYNQIKDGKSKLESGLYFYILLCTCHNNLVRFNKSMGFNQTFGDRLFNSAMEEKMKNFIYKMKDMDINFNSTEFYKFIPKEFDVNDFVYFDPPYLISEAGYNAFWDLDRERRTYTVLDQISTKVKWGLSNILTHKGNTNLILKDWMSKYNVHYLDYNYLKVSKRKMTDTVEIFVTNY